MKPISVRTRGLEPFSKCPLPIRPEERDPWRTRERQRPPRPIWDRCELEGAYADVRR